MKCLTTLIKSLLSSLQKPIPFIFNGTLEMNNTVFALDDSEGKDHVGGYTHKGGLASSGVLTEALLLITVFRHETSHRWMSCSRRFEASKRLRRSDNVVEGSAHDWLAQQPRVLVRRNLCLADGVQNVVSTTVKINVIVLSVFLR